MKMGFVYEAAYPPASSHPRLTQMSLHYVDNNYPGHSGWKEIVALADAASLLHSSVPATDRSGELSNYPTDLLTSPPQDLEASLQVLLPSTLTHVPAEKMQPIGASLPRAVSAVSAARTAQKKALDPPLLPGLAPGHQPSRAIGQSVTPMQLQANRQQTPRSSFTELIQAQRLSPWFLFTAAILAIDASVDCTHWSPATARRSSPPILWAPEARRVTRFFLASS